MYSRLLNSYPLATKCVTSGLIFSAGDIITQKVIQKKSDFDVRRNINFTITGAVYLGPILHVWYSKLMPRVISGLLKTPVDPTSNAHRLKAATVGMLLDQLLFAPPFLTGFFIFNNWIKENCSLKGIENGWKFSKEKMRETLITNWKVWPAATLVNLMFVPIQYRVLFANFIGLFWNTYLSYVASN